MIGDDRLLISVFEQAVVPVRPGRRELSYLDGVYPNALAIDHAVWVPAPVRNCALGRDDG